MLDVARAAVYRYGIRGLVIDVSLLGCLLVAGLACQRVGMACLCKGVGGLAGLGILRQRPGMHLLLAVWLLACCLLCGTLPSTSLSNCLPTTPQALPTLLPQPYNELDHQRPASMNETEYVSQMLTKVKRFAQVRAAPIGAGGRAGVSCAAGCCLVVRGPDCGLDSAR